MRVAGARVPTIAAAVAVAAGRIGTAPEAVVGAQQNLTAAAARGLIETEPNWPQAAGSSSEF